MRRSFSIMKIIIMMALRQELGGGVVIRFYTMPSIYPPQPIPGQRNDDNESNTGSDFFEMQKFLLISFFSIC